MIDSIIAEANMTGAKDEHLAYPNDIQQPPLTSKIRTHHIQLYPSLRHSIMMKKIKIKQLIIVVQ